MDAENNLRDLYKVVRGQIEHVNNNLGQRVIWLVIAQSFFFVGFATLICGNPDSVSKIKMQHSLLLIFPIASLLTVIFSYLDIIVSLIYLKKIKRFYIQEKQKNTIQEIYPPIDGYSNFSILENAASILVPLLFIITWICILIKCNNLNLG